MPALRGLSALVASVFAFATASAARAEPALWVVRSPAGGVVYLFGTIHALKPGAAWRSPKIDAALASASDLWLEIGAPADAEASQDRLERLGAAGSRPLSKTAPAADLARLKGVAAALGAPGGEVLFESMRPWFAALTVTLAPAVQAGYDPAFGADRVLKGLAEAAGKPVRGFETPEAQLSLLADLPPPLQVQFLESALDAFDRGPQTLDRLVADWTRGDVDAVARSEVAPMAAAQPQIYRRLLVERNRRWAKVLAARLRRPGTSFVAVGAAHLAGPDSLQARLAALGFVAERL